MVGLDFNNCVSSLISCHAPMLEELDLSYVAGLNDVALYKILAAPKDSRPGSLLIELTSGFWQILKFKILIVVFKVFTLFLFLISFLWTHFLNSVFPNWLFFTRPSSLISRFPCLNVCLINNDLLKPILANFIFSQEANLNIAILLADVEARVLVERSVDEMKLWVVSLLYFQKRLRM